MAGRQLTSVLIGQKSLANRAMSGRPRERRGGEEGSHESALEGGREVNEAVAAERVRDGTQRDATDAKDQQARDSAACPIWA